MIITAVIADINETLNQRTYSADVLDEVATKATSSIPEKFIPVVDDHLVRVLGEGRQIGYVNDVIYKPNEGNLYGIVKLENPKNWGYQGFWNTIGEYIWTNDEKHRKRWKEEHQLVPIFNGELHDDGKTVAWAELVSISLSKRKNAFKNGKICEISDIPERINFTNLKGEPTWLCNFHITHSIGTYEELHNGTVYPQNVSEEWIKEKMEPGDVLVWYDDIGCLSGSAGYVILRGTQVVSMKTVMRS